MDPITFTIFLRDLDHGVYAGWKFAGVTNLDPLVVWVEHEASAHRYSVSMPYELTRLVNVFEAGREAASHA